MIDVLVAVAHALQGFAEAVFAPGHRDQLDLGADQIP